MRPLPLTALASALLGALLAFGLPAAADDLSVPLRMQIEQFVRSRAPSAGAKVELPPLDDFALEGVSPEQVEVSLSTRSELRGSGTLPVTVVLSSGREELKRGVVTARLARSRAVWVAARPLQRGQTVGPGDLRREQLADRRLPKGALLHAEHAIGMQISRSVGEGRVLRADWLEAPSLVRRGELVRLVHQNSALRIEGVGKAVSDGARGEQVRVVNLDSRREVTGRVVAPGVVHVGF